MIPLNLAAARVTAARKRAYLAPALYALTPVECKGLNTIACDDRWRLFFSEKAINCWSVEELAGALIHEVSHLLRDHSGRSKEISAEHKLFNISADLEINSGMRNEGLKLPAEALYPESMNLPEGKLAEEYYRMLKRQAEEQSKQTEQNQEQSEDESEGNSGGSSIDDDSLDEPSSGGSNGEDSNESDSTADQNENDPDDSDEVEEANKRKSAGGSSKEESEDGNGSSSQGNRSKNGSSNGESSEDESSEPQSNDDSSSDGSQGSNGSEESDEGGSTGDTSDENKSEGSQSDDDGSIGGGSENSGDSAEDDSDSSSSSQQSKAENGSADGEGNEEDGSRNGDSQQPLSGKPAAGHCGSCATGIPEWYEKEADEDYPGLSKFEANKIRKQTARRILEASKSRGDVPEGWRRWAEETASPKVDWRRELRALVRHALIDMSGAVDYSYRRPSRRQSAMPKVVLPSLRNPVPSIAVIIDTSGSINDEMLSQILAEIDGILLANGKREGVHVIACDAKVHWKGKVFKKAQVQALGGGGTDLRVGFDEALKLKPRPQAIIAITDGCTPWPKQAPRGTKTVVALLDADSSVPDWAKVVKIKLAA